MFKALRPALFLLLQMTFLLGVVYPSGVWLVGHFFLRSQAEGSLVLEKGRLVGSALIGQSFTEDKYFWPRPSATSPHPYDFLSSGASQWDPANPLLIQAVKDRLRRLDSDALFSRGVPADLVSASGCGLDPDLSPQAAQFQVERIAAARGLHSYRLRYLIQANTQGRTLGFLGEPRVNVLKLNLALDKMTRDRP